jgi:nicotinamide phosphoribosyltransferase
MYLFGLGHATSFKGSDTLPVIPAARYFYGVREDEMPIYSVNASEHSVSTTKIFTVGESQMITDWLKIFPKGILSIVSDTFDLWKLITEYLPANRDAIMARDGKLVIRPDSGDPVDIICGVQLQPETIDSQPKVWYKGNYVHIDDFPKHERKGVVELLWDIFGGTVNEQGYKVLDPHIGAIYGDSITPERQRQIYERLAAKGFAATNIVLGVGSFTYQYNTRDTLGFAAKGSWFEVEENACGNKTSCCEGQSPDCDNPFVKKAYNIYKDPVTDDGTKKSLKGLLRVDYVNAYDNNKELQVFTEQTPLQESTGLLQTIYEDGKFYNTTTLEEVRNKLNKI